MCFGFFKEPSYRDGSFEYLQHMFWLRNENNNFQLPILRGVEIATFYTCPGTSKWQYCTCPQKYFTCPQNADNAQTSQFSPYCVETKC